MRENKLLLVGGFDNAQAAIDYLQEAKPVATTRIMPWLKPEKYSFSIISSRNLEILKTNLKLDEYRKFAEQNTGRVNFNQTVAVYFIDLMHNN